MPKMSPVVCSLPSVTVLNGSVVTDGEREDAERFYIRYHLDCPEDELPERYISLFKFVATVNMMKVNK